MSRAVIGTLVCALAWAAPSGAAGTDDDERLALSRAKPTLPAAGPTVLQRDAPTLAKRKKRKRRKKKTKKAKEHKQADAAEDRHDAGEVAQPAVPTVPSPPDLPLLAVLPLGADNVPLNDLTRLNEALRDALNKTGRFRLQEQATTNELVSSSQALGLDCAADDEGCAEQLAALTGASLAVVGRVVFIPAASPEEAGSILSGQVAVHLAVIDVEVGQSRRRLRALLPAELNAQPAALQAALTHLLNDQAASGKLKLAVTPEGASIQVDGVVLGTAPLGEVDGLMPGPHVVEVTKEGFVPRRVDVQVVPGPQEVLVFLEEDEALIKERQIAWWEVAGPWSLVGVGGLSAAAGAGLLATAGGLAGMYALTSASLGGLDQQAATFPDDAAAAYQDTRVWRETYNLVGPYFLVAGSILAAAGSLVAATGASWGTYYFFAGNDDADQDASDRGGDGQDVNAE